MKPTGGSVPEPVPGQVPVLDRYGFDPLQAFLAAYDTANSTAYAFGTSSPDDAAAQTAIAAVFPSPGHAAAAAWLADVLRVLNDLAAVTAGLVPASGSDQPAALEFSIMEGLYARGFTSRAQITALDEADFASALTGSVAWQWAQQIWTNAGGAGQPAAPAPGPFRPLPPEIWVLPAAKRAAITPAPPLSPDGLPAPSRTRITAAAGTVPAAGRDDGAFRPGRR